MSFFWLVDLQKEIRKRIVPLLSLLLHLIIMIIIVMGVIKKKKKNSQVASWYFVQHGSANRPPSKTHFVQCEKGVGIEVNINKQDVPFDQNAIIKNSKHTYSYYGNNKGSSSGSNWIQPNI